MNHCAWAQPYLAEAFTPKPIIFPKIIGFTGKPPAQRVPENGFTGLMPHCLVAAF
jgi:hypothetical protein